MAGPLEELVQRILRRVEAFKEDHALEEAEVSVELVDGESLVYWLRKLVFRGAYLDHRVKEGLLEVVWEDGSGEFAYAEPAGGRALLELAPTPSWLALQFRGGDR